MNKVRKGGKVAVLYSPGFGAGWSTWASDEYNCERTAELDQLSPVLCNQQIKQESFQDIRIRVNEAVEKKVRKVLDKS